MSYSKTIQEILKGIDERVPPLEAIAESTRLQQYLKTGTYQRLVEYYATDEVFLTLGAMAGKMPLVNWLEQAQPALNFVVEYQSTINQLIEMAPALAKMAPYNEFVLWYATQQPAIVEILSKKEIIVWYEAHKDDLNTTLTTIIPALQQRQDDLVLTMDARLEETRTAVRAFHDSDIGRIDATISSLRTDFDTSWETIQTDILGSRTRLDTLETNFEADVAKLGQTIKDLQTLGQDYRTYAEAFPARFRAALDNTAIFERLTGLGTAITDHWAALTDDFMDNLGAFSVWLTQMELDLKELLDNWGSLTDFVRKFIGDNLKPYADSLDTLIAHGNTARESLEAMLSDPTITYPILRWGTIRPRKDQWTGTLWAAFAREIKELYEVGKDPSVWDIGPILCQVWNIGSVFNTGGLNFIDNMRDAALQMRNAFDAIRADASTLKQTLINFSLGKPAPIFEPPPECPEGTYWDDLNKACLPLREGEPPPPPPVEPECPEGYYRPIPGEPCMPVEPEPPVEPPPPPPVYTYAGAIHSWGGPTTLYRGDVFTVNIFNASVISSPQGAPVNAYFALKNDDTGEIFQDTMKTINANGQQLSATFTGVAPPYGNALRIRVVFALHNAPDAGVEWLGLDTKYRTITLVGE